MWCLARNFYPFLFIFCLLGVHVMAQEPVQPRSPLRTIDSLARMRVSHHQVSSTGNPAPMFPSSFRPVKVPPGKAMKGVLSATRARPGAASLAGAVPLSGTGTVCYDTSGRYFLQEDTMTYYVDATIRTADGNVLMSGEWSSKNAPYPNGGFLMKCSDSGTVKWAKLYDSLNAYNSFFLFYNLLELQDGSIMMAGQTNDLVTGNMDVILAHTDNTGNIIWNKCYSSSLWGQGSGSADYFNIKQMIQDPAGGDIYLTSPHWAEGKNVTRVHIADGSIAWSRYYQMVGSWSFDSPFGLLIESNELLSFGRVDLTYGGTITSLYRLDKNTGDTISTRFYTTVDPSGFDLSVGQPEVVTKLNNGHYVLPGRLFKYYHYGDTGDLYHAGVEEFDANGDFVKAYCFRNKVESNFYNTRIQVNPDGTGVFSMLEYISGYTANVYYVQFADQQILHQRKRYYLGEGMPGENPAMRLADGSDLLVKMLGDSITNLSKVEFLNLHLSDSSSACLGLTDSSTYTEPYYMVPMQFGLASLPLNDLHETQNKTLHIRDDAPYFLHACQQVAHCDTLSILSPSDTVCMASPLLLTTRKTPGCGAGVFFDFDTTMVQSFKQVNDSIYSFNFKSTGKSTLRGSMRGCNVMSDSVKIVVLASKGAVDLGPDTVICPGNSILLNASSGYASYQWQDGSADSVLTVVQPATYSVAVTDGCGNKYTGMVVVSPHPPIPFDIGPDRKKCNNDTLQLYAPAGFLNYTWGPLYNINMSTGAAVVVNPLSDTIYYVKAEKTPGCFAYDTLRVTVNISPVIKLGNDTSFCYGESAVLDAGAGFSSYLWNDGSAGRQLMVNQAGNWWVQGVGGNGCISTDTLRVMNVWPLPVSKMDHDSLLCYGSTRILQPGNFSTYSWQDGSIATSFTAQDTGRYWVLFTDGHQCQASDTVVITRILAHPSGFLPSDTTVCIYGKLLLRPLRNFDSYVWSTGDLSPSITVSTAGMYELEVTDEHRCAGKDTIIVGTQDCLIGFHMPGAFSPNHDGNNDVLRPLVGGVLTEYNLTIYNRYGEILFNTRNVYQGWDGYFRGRLQEEGAYVWTCVYRFQGQPQQAEKGTFLLVR